MFDVVLLDIDRTIANNNHRSDGLMPNTQEEWDKFYLACEHDTPIERSKMAVRSLCAWIQLSGLIYVTGRDEICRSQTGEWLRKHGYPPSTLLMRPRGDHRRSDLLKRDLVQPFIGRRVVGIDDEDSILVMYHELGFATMKAPNCWRSW
jgi:hypothetical protein